MEANQQILRKNDEQFILSLYDNYAAMLLGYINEIVNNQQLAEQYLAAVFKEILRQQHRIITADNTWCELQRLAKGKVAEMLNNGNNYKSAALAGLRVYQGRNKLIDLMNDEQKLVFCAIYYNGKTTAGLAAELNKPEPYIRAALKEAFAIIRKGREN